MTAEKKVKTPAMSFKVTPLETAYEVTVPAASSWIGDDTFKFTVSAEGDVTINDNFFSTKQQAAKALEAMAAFLKK